MKETECLSITMAHTYVSSWFQSRASCYVLHISSIAATYKTKCWKSLGFSDFPTSHKICLLIDPVVYYYFWKINICLRWKNKIIQKDTQWKLSVPPIVVPPNDTPLWPIYPEILYAYQAYKCIYNPHFVHKWEHTYTTLYTFIYSSNNRSYRLLQTNT